MNATPYYSQDGITIYCGDSEVIAPALGARLVITDPPYGMDYQSAWRTDWQRKPKIHGDAQFPKWLFDLSPAVALMTCCRWDNLYEIPQPDSFVAWDKCSHSMGDLKHEFGRQWEGVAFYAGLHHVFTRRPVDVIRVPCVPSSSLVHPNEKPVALFTPLITCHGDEVIVDPFCGSGPVLQAAKLLGRRAIGIEINEEYCKLAVERLRQGVLITT